jgi:hypothetical protein
MRAPIVLTLLLPVLATAAPGQRHAPTADEFALRLPLEVSGDNGVVQLQLPLSVYQASRSPELADLRVYNGAGQLLPYALHRPSYRTHIELREADTRLFPIYRSAQAASGSGDLQLELRTGPDGAVVSVETRGAAPVTDSGETLAALIVDLGASAQGEVLESLRFELPASAPNYQARLAIERSQDLKRWDGIANGSLDWIRSADESQRLINDGIEVPPGAGRYLRLRWIEGEPLQFSAVHARWRSATVTPDPTLEIELEGRPGRVEGDYAYTTSPAIVATALGLELPEPNTVLPVSIGFYRDQGQRSPRWWLQPRVQSTFYRLKQNGSERRSGRISIAPMSGEEWILRPHNPAQAAPKLVLEWRPQTLVFNAQGQDFVLAVGAAPEVYRRWTGGPAPLSQVAPDFSAREIEQLERAGVGAPIGTAAVEAAPAAGASDASDSSRLRRFVLWAVLGVGVLLLGFMSWRLYGQLSRSEKTD